MDHEIPIVDELRAVRRQLRHLNEEMNNGGRPADEVVTELETALEELRVAEEELVAQRAELAVRRGELQAELERWRSAYSDAPVASLVTNADGAVRVANVAAADLLGVQPRRLVGKPLPAYVAPDDRFAFRTALSQLPDVPWVPDWRFHVVPRGAGPLQITASVRVVRPAAPPDRSQAELGWVLSPATSAPASPEVVGQLQHALSARVSVEQAKGMLMAKLGMEPEEAFEVMRRRARAARRPVTGIAADVIAGWMPGPDGEAG
jgi:PAS domain-containing protein